MPQEKLPSLNELDFASDTFSAEDMHASQDTGHHSTRTIASCPSTFSTFSDTTLINQRCVLELTPNFQINIAMVAASVVGKSHIKSQTPNQDAVYVATIPHGCLMVVGDGVGSAPMSHFGSRLLGQAVEYTCLKLMPSLSSLDELNISSFLMTLHTEWLDLLSKQGHQAQECQTTCLIALIFKDKLLLTQIGDGLMGVIKQEEFIALPNPEIQALSFSNMTYALGTKVHLSKWVYQIRPLSELQGIIACTDGVVNMLKPEELGNFMQDFMEFLNPQSPLDAAKAIKELLDNWNREHFTDDLTFGCMYPLVYA